MITGNWKRLLLDPLLPMNFLLIMMLNQKIILTVHILIMTPRLIVSAVLNIKHMYHQLIISGNIIQENMGKNSWKPPQQVCKAETEATYIDFFVEKINFNSSAFYFISFWTRVEILLTVHLLVWNIMVLINIVYI